MKFHTLHHENKGRLVHVHVPIKIIQTHLQQINQKKYKYIYQQLQNKNKMLLPQSFITDLPLFKNDLVPQICP